MTIICAPIYISQHCIYLDETSRENRPVTRICIKQLRNNNKDISIKIRVGDIAFAKGRYFILLLSKGLTTFFIQNALDSDKVPNTKEEPV